MPLLINAISIWKRVLFAHRRVQTVARRVCINVDAVIAVQLATNRSGRDGRAVLLCCCYLATELTTELARTRTADLEGPHRKVYLVGRLVALDGLLKYLFLRSARCPTPAIDLANKTVDCSQIRWHGKL